MDDRDKASLFSGENKGKQTGQDQQKDSGQQDGNIEKDEPVYHDIGEGTKQEENPQMGEEEMPEEPAG